MKSEKREESVSMSLQGRADAAVAKWREAECAREAASQAARIAGDISEKSRRPTGPAEPEKRLAAITAEIRKLEAEDAARHAHAMAAEAVGAAEEADGDALARECSLRALREDLAAIDSDVERLEREIAEQQARVRSRIASAVEAQTRVAARRRERGLPIPVGFPRAVPTLKVYIDLLEQTAARIDLSDTPNARRVRFLEEEELELRVSIEVARRASEEQAEREADYDRRQADERRTDECRRRKESEALQRKHASEQEEHRKLAESQRAQERR